MISKETLSKFAQAVVEDAQRNVGATRIIRGKSRRLDMTGTLRNSLGYEVVETGGAAVIQFGSSVDYAKYQEHGVSGTKKTYGGTPYRFTTKMPPPQAMLRYVEKRPIRIRDAKTGKFLRATKARKKSTAFLIGRSIFRYGIEPKHFFQDAILDQLINLPEEVVKDLEKQIELTLQKATE